MPVVEKDRAIPTPERYEEEDFLDRIERAKAARSAARKAHDRKPIRDTEAGTPVDSSPKSFVR